MERPNSYVLCMCLYKSPLMFSLINIYFFFYSIIYQIFKVKIWFQNRRARQRREEAQQKARSEQSSPEAVENQVRPPTQQQTLPNPCPKNPTVFDGGIPKGSAATPSHDGGLESASSTPSYTLKEMTDFYRQNFHQSWL